MGNRRKRIAHCFFLLFFYFLYNEQWKRSIGRTGYPTHMLMDSMPCLAYRLWRGLSAWFRSRNTQVFTSLSKLLLNNSVEQDDIKIDEAFLLLVSLTLLIIGFSLLNIMTNRKSDWWPIILHCSRRYWKFYFGCLMLNNNTTPLSSCLDRHKCAFTLKAVVNAAFYIVPTGKSIRSLPVGTVNMVNIF